MGEARRWVNPTIQYLRQALRADRRIDALIERAEHYREQAVRATGRATATRVSGTGMRSNVEAGVCKLVDLSRDLERLAEELAEVVRQIEREIDRVQDDRHRDLLRWRYLNGWRWERIAEAMGYTDVKWLYKLHGRALVEFEKFLE